MLKSYLSLSLELFDEESSKIGFKGFQNSSMLDFKFNLKN